LKLKGKRIPVPQNNGTVTSCSNPQVHRSFWIENQKFDDFVLILGSSAGKTRLSFFLPAALANERCLSVQSWLPVIASQSQNFGFARSILAAVSCNSKEFAVLSCTPLPSS
jgi:hypothetical protein